MLFAGSDKFTKIKLSQTVSASLRSNGVHGEPTYPNPLSSNNQYTFAEEVHKVLNFTNQEVGDNQYLWLGWSFDQQNHILEHVGKYCDEVDKKFE